MLKFKLKIVALLSLFIFTISGCSYYKITDTATGNIYHTDSIKRHSSGAIELTDVSTNKTVTITNSEIQKISSDKFNAAKYKSND